MAKKKVVCPVCHTVCVRRDGRNLIYLNHDDGKPASTKLDWCPTCNLALLPDSGTGSIMNDMTLAIQRDYANKKIKKS